MNSHRHNSSIHFVLAYDVIEIDKRRRLEHWIHDKEENIGIIDTNKMKQEKNDFIARNAETLKIAKTYLPLLPRVFWYQDKPKYNNDTIYEGLIEFEK